MVSSISQRAADGAHLACCRIDAFAAIDTMLDTFVTAETMSEPPIVLPVDARFA